MKFLGVDVVPISKNPRWFQFCPGGYVMKVDYYWRLYYDIRRKESKVYMQELEIGHLRKKFEAVRQTM